MSLPMGAAWEDENEQIYLVAPPNTTPLAIKRRMLKHCRQAWLGAGDKITLEGEPRLKYLREPEGDEDEERLFDVEPDDPRAHPVWVVSYWVDFAPSEWTDASEGTGRRDA